MRRLYENMGIPLRSPLPPDRHWNYNMPVFGVNCTVQNTIGENDYLFEVNLTDENFDFSRAERDGGDIGFKDSLGRNLRSFVHRWSAENKTGQCIVAAYEPGDTNDQPLTMFYGNSHKDYDYPTEESIVIENYKVFDIPYNVPPEDPLPTQSPLYWNISGSYDHPFTANITMPMGYYTMCIQGAYCLTCVDQNHDPNTQNCGTGSGSQVAACGWSSPNGGHMRINYGVNRSCGPYGDWYTKTVPSITTNRSLPGQFGYGHFYVPYSALFKIWITNEVQSDNDGYATLTIYRNTKNEGF